MKYDIKTAIIMEVHKNIINYLQSTAGYRINRDNEDGVFDLISAGMNSFAFDIRIYVGNNLV